MRSRIPPARERRDDFESYRQEQGEALLRFAAFEVLRLKYAPDPWPRWPQPWRKPDIETLLQFRAENEDACAFQEFMQWTADRQLRACQDAARRHGMSIGLYTDLAVGIDPHGADAWSEQDAIVTDVSIGAPPDEFNRGRAELGPGAVQSAQHGEERLCAIAPPDAGQLCGTPARCGSIMCSD